MPGFREEGDYDRAREVLQAADFSEAAIGQVIGRTDIYRMPSSDVPHVLRRAREPSRLHTLIRLYFLGLPVPEDEVRSALAPVPLEVWVGGDCSVRRTVTARSSRSCRSGPWPVDSWPWTSRGAGRRPRPRTSSCHQDPSRCNWPT